MFDMHCTVYTAQKWVFNLFQVQNWNVFFVQHWFIDVSFFGEPHLPAFNLKVQQLVEYIFVWFELASISHLKSEGKNQIFFFLVGGSF